MNFGLFITMHFNTYLILLFQKYPEKSIFFGDCNLPIFLNISEISHTLGVNAKKYAAGLSREFVHIKNFYVSSYYIQVQEEDKSITFNTLNILFLVMLWGTQ